MMMCSALRALQGSGSVGYDGRAPPVRYQCDTKHHIDAYLMVKVWTKNNSRVNLMMPDLRDTTAHLMPVRDPQSSKTLETAKTPSASPTVHESLKDLKATPKSHRVGPPDHTRHTSSFQSQ